MKKILFSLVFSIIALAATCQVKNSYTISGLIGQPTTKVYLKEKIGNDIIKLDSAIVKNGKFTFTGRQDSAKFCFLEYNPDGKVNRYHSFFLENGSMSVIIGKWEHENRMTGTTNNDLYAIYQKEVIELMTLLRHSGPESENSELVKAKKQKVKNIQENILDDHLHTGIGLHILTTERFSVERTKELISRLTEEELKNPKIQKVIKETEHREKKVATKE